MDRAPAELTPEPESANPCPPPERPRRATDPAPLRVRLAPCFVAACALGCGAVLWFVCEGIDGTEGILPAVGLLGGTAILLAWLPGITVAWVLRGLLGLHAVPWFSWPIATNVILWGTTIDPGTSGRRCALVLIGIVTGPWLLMLVAGAWFDSPFRNP